MIPSFPTPYPDELFYSVLVRYHLWSRNQTKEETMKDLFRDSSISPVASFPSRLSVLVEQLDHEKLTCQYFIDNTTLFPFYRPFIEEERVNRITAFMRGEANNNTHIQMMIGHLDKKNKYLFYCPACFQEEVLRLGEAYWHRTHQVFGVKVCPIHNVWLIESMVLHSSENLNPLNKAVMKEGKNVYHSKQKNPFYFSIAQSVHWILCHSPPTLGLEEFKKRYKFLLHDSTFLTYSEKIRFKSLIPNIIDTLGEEFLQDMQSSLSPTQRSSWLRGIFKDYVKAVHPIKHLVLMLALNTAPTDYFSLNPKNYAPFGEGPWPCLNRAASHFHEPVIEECFIQRQDTTGKPYATFKCSCGFVYKRIGPDRSPTDKYNHSYIVSYGSVWEQKVVDSKSLRQTAKELRSCRKTITKQYKRLVNQESPTDDRFHLDRKKHREAWYSTLSQYNGKTVSDMRNIARATYEWLYRNDKQWLNKHSPQLIRSVPRYSRKGLDYNYWNRIDKETYPQLKGIVEAVSYRNGKPNRVTITAVSDRLRNKNFLRKNIDRLPKTRECLTPLLESVEAFRVRRLKWVLRRMKEDNELLTWSKIIAKSGIRNHNLTAEMNDIIERGLIEEYIFISDL
ncbi:TnsD family Tn7-like transposition protein [Salipaludibacillus sp. CF4.18]|uniref:TnsD family Tn7-like transposition protein n=1 Tax=Salipaludibacillus sp. CF4.18 TaxID=3373081 RepID=UPI003EE46867